MSKRQLKLSERHSHTFHCSHHDLLTNTYCIYDIVISLNHPTLKLTNQSLMPCEDQPKPVSICIGAAAGNTSLSNVSFRSLSRNRIYSEACSRHHFKSQSPADYSLFICPSSLSLLFSQQSHHNLHHVSEGEKQQPMPHLILHSSCTVISFSASVQENGAEGEVCQSANIFTRHKMSI